MQKEILQKIVEKWKNDNLEISLPYTKNQVLKSFAKIGKQVSNDILEVYTTFGGLADDGIDSNLMSFWTLDQLESENLSRKSEFTFFGDFLIFSHSYGYKYENENVSSVYSDYETAEFKKISDSVEEFFHLYITDPTEIGLYKEPIK